MFEIYLSLILKGIKKFDDVKEADKANFKAFCDEKLAKGELLINDYRYVINS